jgi:alkaline phosphatase D
MRQATGVKVGEVTAESAIVWTRVTERAGPVTAAEAAADDVRALVGACPGMPGRVRVRYGEKEDLSDAKVMDWIRVEAATDFTHPFKLAGLKPKTRYSFETETAGPNGERHDVLRGSFQTAPAPDDPAEVVFTVTTCQRYDTQDTPEGQRVYASMLDVKPRFTVSNGDTVYYDQEKPMATSPALARHLWHRAYSLPKPLAFHRRVPGYWLKDDHDTLADDCWPAMTRIKTAPLTFVEGQRIFREQVPMGEKTYRTFRWGRGLQIWLVEGRDFRSPNSSPDGPEKTIWGAEQKAWLKASIRASDADWRVLISPTPLVGPDRKGKGDNHSNLAFATEGKEIRTWIQQNGGGNLFVVNGDRHWQYHSVDPETGVHEFSCGPTTDRHAGGTPGENPAYHKYHRVCGGFLSVAVTPEGGGSRIRFRHHDTEGKALYEWATAASRPRGDSTRQK